MSALIDWERCSSHLGRASHRRRDPGRATKRPRTTTARATRRGDPHAPEFAILRSVFRPARPTAAAPCRRSARR